MDGNKFGDFLMQTVCSLRTLTHSAVLTAVWFGWLTETGAAASSERPNLLLIITDQQHFGMMGCAGNPYVKTPALDGLAARGVRFGRAYCANPVCVPSRFSMMTGVLPSRIGMESNRPGTLALTEQILNHAMGHIFRTAGYKTVYGGKVHLPGTARKGLAAYGFTPLTKDQREGLAESCAEFFRQDHKRPFLLVASFINPHDICLMAIDAYTQANNLPVKYPNLVRDRQCLAEALRLPSGISRAELLAKTCPPLPANFEVTASAPSALLEFSGFRQYVFKHWSEEQWRLHRWAYTRLTERVDAHIGRVLEALREADLAHKTVVIFTSDHGDMDAAHRLEHKSMPYDEAARVPLIVSYPTVTASGIVDQRHLVSTGLDLIPTLCDFAGIPQPSALAGRSVKPLTVTPDAEYPWRDTLVVENHRSRILCSKSYKYTVYNHGQPREMLTDLEADPGEMKNLAVDARYRKTLAEHRRWLRLWYQENSETLGKEYVAGSAGASNLNSADRIRTDNR